jgi:hypothetical protein
MRIRLTVAFAVMGAMLVGCSGPAAPDAGAAPAKSTSPTAAPTGGSGSSGSAGGVAPASGRFATPLPSGSSLEPEVALSEEESAANSAAIDSFLAEQWKAGTKPSTLSAALPGDCVFFDWNIPPDPLRLPSFPCPAMSHTKVRSSASSLMRTSPFPASARLAMSPSAPAQPFWNSTLKSWLPATASGRSLPLTLIGRPANAVRCAYTARPGACRSEATSGISAPVPSAADCVNSV